MQTRATVVILALLVLAAISTAAIPTVKADTGIPIWQKGNWWQYVLTNVTAPSGGTGSGTLKTLVIGTTNLTVAGVTYPTYDTRNWLNLTSGGFTYTLTGDAWFRTVDLAPVRATFGFTITVSGTTFTISDTLTYVPPQEMMWPLTAGAMWSSTSIVSSLLVTTGNGISMANLTSSSVTYQYTVQTETHITVPKGNFTVTPVQQTEIGVLGYTVTYWSGEVGSDAKQAIYDSNGNEQSSENLVDYSYTPPPPGGTASFLGLAFWVLLVVIVIAAAAAIAAILLLRPKRPMPSPMPPSQPPAMPTVPPESSTQGPPGSGGPPPPPP